VKGKGKRAHKLESGGKWRLLQIISLARSTEQKISQCLHVHFPL